MKFLPAVLLSLLAAPALAQDPAQYSGTASFFNNDAPEQVNFVRAFVEPAWRINGDNTASGPGLEAGVVAAYEKGLPTVGFSVGYYAMDDRFDSSRSYKLIPVLVRVGFDFPLRDGGPAFSLSAAGGYSINSYESDDASVTSTLDNSYVLQGQAAFRWPLSQYVTASLACGYQYLKPELAVRSGGQTTKSYVDLGAPFVKLNFEF